MFTVIINTPTGGNHQERHTERTLNGAMTLRAAYLHHDKGCAVTIFDSAATAGYRHNGVLIHGTAVPLREETPDEAAETAAYYESLEALR